MKREQYTALIDNSIMYGTNAPSKLGELLQALQEDIEVKESEKLEIEKDINNKRETLLPAEKKKNGNSSNGKSIKRFPDYNFQLNIINPDGVKENNPSDLPYAIWYRDIYLPKFHPMPYPEIQYPIVTVLALLNSKAIIDTHTKLPMPYFLGLRGSGKTQLADQIRLHYDHNYSLEIKPNWTGASIRDILDERFNDGEPCLAVFDNFNPEESIKRIGVHYDILLANDKKSSVSRVSTKNNQEGKSEYNTYCYKILTSVFDLDSAAPPEAKEIQRRCLTLLFQTGEPEDSKEAYVWDSMQQEYNKIWGYKALPELNSVYCLTLHELNKLKPSKLPIKGSNWELCKLPIAIGVYVGIFKNISHGISHFRDYFEWFPTAKSSSTKDMLSLTVQQYINIEHVSLCEREKVMSAYTVPKYTMNKISNADLKKYVEKMIGGSVQRGDQKIISQILGEYGYVMDIINDIVYYIKKD